MRNEPSGIHEVLNAGNNSLGTVPELVKTKPNSGNIFNRCINGDQVLACRLLLYVFHQLFEFALFIEEDVEKAVGHLKVSDNIGEKLLTLKLAGEELRAFSKIGGAGKCIKKNHELPRLEGLLKETEMLRFQPTKSFLHGFQMGTDILQGHGILRGNQLRVKLSNLLDFS